MFRAMTSPPLQAHTQGKSMTGSSNAARVTLYGSFHRTHLLSAWSQHPNPINTYLLECPIHADARQHLLNESQGLVLADILGSEEGIEALVEFLKDSPAFKNSHHQTTMPHTVLTMYMHLSCYVLSSRSFSTRIYYQST